MNVAKGKGQYAGEGGFMTTLLSALTAVANNPVVKRLGKKAAKRAVDKAADFAKSKVSNSLTQAFERKERRSDLFQNALF